MKYFKFEALRQENNWVSPAYVGVTPQGIINYLAEAAPSDSVAVEVIPGVALPGFQNAHSHAFQYAMAGKAEKHAPESSDDFWSWREAMYSYALSLTPEHVEAVAAMLYAEMLRKGYTHVAEFHYLHHDSNGKPYNNLAEMGGRLISAAKTAGIKITLIPIFYQRGNFDKPHEIKQRRFISATLDDYLRLLEISAQIIRDQPHARLGFGVHSLRAVDPQDVVRTVSYGPAIIPFHLHVAEQKKEVEDCKRYLNRRPVEWIIENLPVTERFQLVHCTHLNDNEVMALVKAKANVVLCPGTEGNLGDGIFRLKDFASAKGSWCIGSDSQISLNLLEDLRWLDYNQRLILNKRNTFDDGASLLFCNAIHSGRKAMGVTASDFFSVGKPFDAVIYNAKSPLFYQSELVTLLSAIVYTADASDIYGTIVDGEWIVREKHKRHEQIFSNFAKETQSLRGIS